MRKNKEVARRTFKREQGERAKIRMEPGSPFGSLTYSQRIETLPKQQFSKFLTFFIRKSNTSKLLMLTSWQSTLLWMVTCSIKIQMKPDDNWRPELILVCQHWLSFFFSFLLFFNRNFCLELIVALLKA